jgi:phage terminase Nu1 subunit (DNA packaging protein)
MTDDERIAALLGFDASQAIAADCDVITTDALADLLGLSDRHVQTLTRQGVLKLVRKGRYHRRDSVRAYCADMRKKAAGRGSASSEYTAAKTRAAAAQAEKLETANAVARRELIPADAVEREWAAILRDVRAAVLALPSRVQQRLGHLTTHDLTTMDREARDLLTELGTANESG